VRPEFSVVIPVYREPHRVASLIQTYSDALQEFTPDWELLVVVNGSPDDTAEVARQAAGGRPGVRVLETPLGGWGRAVKLGLREARGRFLCYTNAARTDLKDLVLALNYARVNEEVVVKASRIVRDSWIRKLGSSLYNFEFRVFFKVPVWDVNGTPKVLPQRVLRALPPLEDWSDGDLIDAELVARCFGRGIHILEMPVLLTRRYGGKSTTNWRSALHMYLGLASMFARRGNV
jgi:glycosyltransferase involved in cell wall biosynthesis